MPAPSTTGSTVLALILLQTFFILILVIRNRRHLRARVHSQESITEVAHAARLAIAGEITASVAHEITQPLSAILNNVEAAELLLRQPDPDLPLVLEILSDVRQDDLRAGAIVQRLRTFLSKRELRLERVDINAAAKDALRLIMTDAVRRGITIRTVLQSDLPMVLADPIHLQQVLLNLLINAMDAMQETIASARALEIRTQLVNDGFLQVTIIDQGPGIQKADRDRMFDAFVTTKHNGMGLGLSIARSIIAMHGGVIWAQDHEGGGAVFEFTLPVRFA